ncbi:S-layer homology domain-containing protein, partial [Veillonella montpellierensis]|uniref:S-layer homology domain-containing protein n=1 Tax=Veillonella montpellierensis TaxID=187328 RepID=UPI0018CECC33
FFDSLKGKDGTDANIDIKDDTESGVSVTPTTDNAGKKTYTIGLKPKIKVGEVAIDGMKDKANIVVGDVKLNGEKGKGTITGLSNTKWDGQHIVSGRAATEDQLQQATEAMKYQVVDMTKQIHSVGASAAALAALHPLDFDPDDKWDFAAGYGNYRGANATSLGAYYRPNEDTMFSIGGSFGGGDKMVNAGIAVKLGQGNHVTTSRVAMAKEIKDLRAEVEVLRQAMVGMSQGKALDPLKMKLFPDIEKNHWAYEAVTKLLQQGVLEGYPDGTFKGDRMMTRYEFAMLVYKAMQRGMNVNERLIQEFEPELERFRIDVIAKDKAGHPTIERVRVNQVARTGKEVH